MPVKHLATKSKRGVGKRGQIPKNATELENEVGTSRQLRYQIKSAAHMLFINMIYYDYNSSHTTLIVYGLNLGYTSTKKHQVPRITIPILATKNFTLHHAMCIPQKCLVEFTCSKVIPSPNKSFEQFPRHERCKKIFIFLTRLLR